MARFRPVNPVPPPEPLPQPELDETKPLDEESGSYQIDTFISLNSPPMLRPSEVAKIFGYAPETDLMGALLEDIDNGRKKLT